MINPVEAAAAFDTLAVEFSPAEQRAIALRSTIYAALILLVFGIVGEQLLRALGVSFAAFRIAGGLLLLKVGFGMVFAQKDDSDRTNAAAHEATAPKSDPSVFPLAIPIITGPGALTAMVTLMANAHDQILPMAVISLMAILVFAITYVTMRGSQMLVKLLGPTGIDVVGRIMGILVSAIAIQIVLAGIVEFVPQVVHAI